MFSLVVIAFLQLGAQDLCGDLGTRGQDFCNGEFFCRWTGSACVNDDCADVRATPYTDVLTGCSTDRNTYNGVTYYYRYSTVKAVGSTFACSLDYAYTNDVLETPFCDTTFCEEIVSGPGGTSSCTDYCFANPAEPSCDTTCTSSGSVCCAIITAATCDSYCAASGTQKTCCGGPQTYATTSTNACGNYTIHSSTQNQADRTRCLNDPTNLTACAMCTTYITCCSIYKEDAAVSAPICDHFCGLKETDDDCKKRKECLASLGHEPSMEELTKCGTSMVRLSSFCVAVLLGLVGYFVLGL